MTAGHDARIAENDLRSDHAISIRDLQFGYGDGPPVLLIDALDVAPGERVLVTGPSGGGKSTLLGLLAGVLTAEPGTVNVLGSDLAGLSGTERDRFRGTHIGYIFQMFNLIPHLSCGENIGLPCRLNPSRRERLGDDGIGRSVAEMAGRLGIEGLVDQPVTQLSVGQQQRVAAARALIGSPPLVLADEPTSALDAGHRDRFLELLFECCDAADATLLFVSHDRDLAAHFQRNIHLPDVSGSGSVAGGASPRG